MLRATAHLLLLKHSCCWAPLAAALHGLLMALGCAQQEGTAQLLCLGVARPSVGWHILPLRHVGKEPVRGCTGNSRCTTVSSMLCRSRQMGGLRPETRARLHQRPSHLCLTSMLWETAGETRLPCPWPWMKAQLAAEQCCAQL